MSKSSHEKGMNGQEMKIGAHQQLINPNQPDDNSDAMHDTIPGAAFAADAPTNANVGWLCSQPYSRGQ